MFHTSTHRSDWMFDSVSTLDKMRSSALQNSVSDAQAARGPDTPPTAYLEVSESKLIVRHFEKVLAHFCRNLSATTGDHVIATATTYLKRYYLVRSALDHPPDRIMRLAVFLACKAEDVRIDLSDMVSARNVPKDEADFIRKHELELLSAIKFHLVVHSPLRALRGFILDLKATTEISESVDQVFEYSKMKVLEWLCTDAVLIYPPSQVAMAALVVGAEHCKVDIEPYMVKVSEGAPEKRQALRDSVAGVQAVAAKSPELTNEGIAALLAKLQRCRNPRYDPESPMFAKAHAADLGFDIDEPSLKRKKLVPDVDVGPTKRVKIECDDD